MAELPHTHTRDLHEKLAHARAHLDALHKGIHEAAVEAERKAQENRVNASLMAQSSGPQATESPAKLPVGIESTPAT